MASGRFFLRWTWADGFVENDEVCAGALGRWLRSFRDLDMLIFGVHGSFPDNGKIRGHPLMIGWTVVSSVSIDFR